MTAQRSGSPPRLRPFGLRAQVALGLLIGAVVLAALIGGDASPFSVTDWLTQAFDLRSLPGLLVVLLLAIVVHELGHLLAGRAVGFRLRLLNLGPLGLQRTPAGWRLQLGLQRLLGAQVLTLPAGPASLRSRHCLMIAGGPALHLLLALALGLAARAMPSLWAGAVLAGATGLVNLVPWTLAGGMWSDGRWLVTWLVRPARAAQRVAVVTLQLAATDGIRPRHWDERWVPPAAGPPSPSAARVALAGALLAYAWALDTGRTQEAARFVRQAAASAGGLPSEARQLALLELAFFQARFACDRSGAESVLAPIRDHLRPALVADRLRVEAAIHLAAGHRGEALDACRQALAALVPGPRVPAALMDLRREQVEAIREDALRIA